jgi:hypothetical protein
MLIIHKYNGTTALPALSVIPVLSVIPAQAGIHTLQSCGFPPARE